MEAQTQSFLLEVLHVGREELEDPEHFNIMLLLADNRRRWQRVVNTGRANGLQARR